MHQLLEGESCDDCAPIRLPFGQTRQTGAVTEARGILLVVALMATTALTLALGITDPASLSYPTKFLVWNLVLAWMPMVFAVAFDLVERRLWLLPLGLGWLAFLPNAPYLVTDLVHLGEGYELWRHVLQYGFAAWTGPSFAAPIVAGRIAHELGAGAPTARPAETIADAVHTVLDRCAQEDLSHR